MDTKIFLLCGAVAVGLCRFAYGGTFDETTGQVTIDEASLSLGFEDAAAPAELPLTIYNASFAIAELDDLRVETQTIEGDWAFQMGSTRSPLVILDLSQAAQQLQRAEIKFWQRANGTRVRAFLIWFSGPVSQALQSVDFSSLFDLGVLPLMPSGRRTSDGWVEMSSGPFDLQLAGELSPILIIEDVQRLNQPPFAPSNEGTAFLDAFELLDRGEAKTLGQACNLVNEDTTCGAEGRCLLGKCADRAVVDGPIFSDARLRREFLDQRLFELSSFGGHRLLRSNLDGLAATVETLKAEPQHPRFWETLTASLDALGDGHVNPPVMNPVTPIPSGICVHQSDVDLMPPSSAPLSPMVFRTSDSHPASGQLMPGDVLVEIDGVSVESWRQLADPRLRYSAAPSARAVITTPQLTGLAMSTGATLEFARCSRMDGAPCQPDELTRFVIQTATITAGLWDHEPPAWLSTQLFCEPRFSRIAPAQDIGSGTYADVVDRGDVRLLAINGTPGTFFPGGQLWFQETAAAFDQPPSKMVLDERRGDGGSFQGVHWLTRFFFAQPSYPADIVFPWLGASEADTDLRRSMVDCSRAGGPPLFGYYACGGVLFAGAGMIDGLNHPDEGVAADVKLAILTGQDGSGNDWLTYHLGRMRPPELSRIFGPAQLFGAYGEVIGAPFHRLGFSGGSFQWTGGVIVGSDQDPLDVHLGGQGVVPDEVIFQKQSDAVQGVDTLMQAALRWLAED